MMRWYLVHPNKMIATYMHAWNIAACRIHACMRMDDVHIEKSKRVQVLPIYRAMLKASQNYKFI